MIMFDRSIGKMLNYEGLGWMKLWHGNDVLNVILNL
ncbi:hypothetical protein V6Z11_A08G214900 [Gossypium hirsutum]